MSKYFEKVSMYIKRYFSNYGMFQFFMANIFLKNITIIIVKGFSFFNFSNKILCGSLHYNY